MTENSPEQEISRQPMSEWLVTEEDDYNRQARAYQVFSKYLDENDPNVRFALGGLEATQRLLSGARAAMEASQGIDSVPKSWKATELTDED